MVDLYSTGGQHMSVDELSYNGLVQQYGQDMVDKLYSQLGWQRQGSGSSDALLNYAKDLNIPWSDSTKDYLIESFLNEKASQNAFDRSVFASKNQYQWLVEDLKKAGLNPFLALSGMNASAATSSGQGVSGGLLTSKANNRATNEANIMKALFTALASIVGIALFKKM